MTFDVRIGINPISWTNDDLPWLGGEIPLEVALSEGKTIGYEGFELGNKFPREPKALRDVLARHGLALVSGWYSGLLARRLSATVAPGRRWVDRSAWKRDKAPSMSYTELLSNRAQIASHTLSVLHYACPTDHFQVRDLCQVGQDLILHAIGEEGILLVGAQVFKG